jgi:hypothetical protein
MSVLSNPKDRMLAGLDLIPKLGFAQPQHATGLANAQAIRWGGRWLYAESCVKAAGARILGGYHTASRGHHDSRSCT